MTTLLVIDAMESVTASPVDETICTEMGVEMGKVTVDPAVKKLSAVRSRACQAPPCQMDIAATG
jgi:hypothetical protein